MPTLPPAGGSADKPRSDGTTPPGSTSQHVDSIRSMQKASRGSAHSEFTNDKKSSENMNREDVQPHAVFSVAEECSVRKSLEVAGKGLAGVG